MDVRGEKLLGDKQMPETLNLIQKQKLARKIKPFILKEVIMYRVGQHNKMHRCLTTSKAQIVLKELHEGVVGGHFVEDIIAQNFFDVSYQWPTLFKDIHEFCRSCDNCQKIGGLKIKKLTKLVKLITHKENE